MKILARTQHRQLRWSRSGQLESNHVATETRTAQLADDGTIIQMTTDELIRGFNCMRAFNKHRKLWLKFMTRNPLDSFHMECHERTVCVLGAPMAWLYEPHTWRLYLGLTTPALGKRIYSRTYRGAHPPSRELMRRIAQLRGIKRIQRRPYKGEAVLLSGEVLLQAMHTAIDQLIMRSEGAGRWHSYAPPLPGDRRLSFRESFQETRFLPNQVETPPAHALHVLDYDADEWALICVDPCGGHPTRLILNEPLYRFANKLRFGRQVESLVVKDTLYHMPQAWISEI